jgi:hypothetical protein
MVFVNFCYIFAYKAVDFAGWTEFEDRRLSEIVYREKGNFPLAIDDIASSEEL